MDVGRLQSADLGSGWAGCKYFIYIFIVIRIWLLRVENTGLDNGRRRTKENYIRMEEGARCLQAESFCDHSR